MLSLDPAQRLAHGSHSVLCPSLFQAEDSTGGWRGPPCGADWKGSAELASQMQVSTGGMLKVRLPEWPEEPGFVLSHNSLASAKAGPSRLCVGSLVVQREGKERGTTFQVGVTEAWRRICRWERGRWSAGIWDLGGVLYLFFQGCLGRACQLCLCWERSHLGRSLLGEAIVWIPWVWSWLHHYDAQYPLKLCNSREARTRDVGLLRVLPSLTPKGINTNTSTDRTRKGRH